MSKGMRRVAVLAVFLAILSGAAIVAYLFVSPTLIALRHRIHLAERRIEVLGRQRSMPARLHQSQRGAARFGKIPSASVFNPNASWERIGGRGTNGSWDSTRYLKSKALAVYRDNLFVGLLSQSPGEAAVWQFDGMKWRRIGHRTIDSRWRKHRNKLCFLA